jgi:fructose-specific phosphotransferase system IIC component
MNSTKTLFLVISMLPWLLVGGALIYLAPAIANQVLHSETTATWLATLSRSGYYPKLASFTALGMSVVGTILTIVGSKYFPNDRKAKAQ